LIVPDSKSHREPIEELAESFLARFRAGERPALTEFIAAHPELAEQIRELFPALVEMEQAGSMVESATGFALPGARGGAAMTESLGDYRIIREVGRGGMGVVYEAIQESLGRHVALKVFVHSSRTDPKLIERFQREARAAARLHHTNIVPVFGVGEHGAHRYYAMQFIQGQGLDAILHELRRLRSAPHADGAGAAPSARTRSGPLAATVAQGLLTGRFAIRASDAGSDGTTTEAQTNGFELGDAPRESEPAPAAPSSDASHWASQAGSSYAHTIARVGLQVAEALAHAHGQGILHRDIKPSNLLLDIEGNIWVTDFGLAKADDAEALTEPGDIVGTLRYMSPERFRGDSGPEGDVYGLGMTLYELLTLRPAFDEGDRARLIDHVLHTDPPPPRAVDPKVPRDLETIVLKAIAKHPADRYVSARALAEDLGRFLQDRTILARRSSLSERLWRWCKRNPALAALAALAATLTTAIAIISTVAALWLGRSRNEALANLGRATSADAGRTRQLWESSLAQARAGRFSHRVGQRFGSLDALKRAASLGVFPERKGELRDEAIASLALPDIRFERSLGVSSPEDFAGDWIAFDSAFERFAYIDREGAITLRRVDTSEVLGHLPGPGWRPNWIRLFFSPDSEWLVIDYFPDFPGINRLGPILAWEVRGGVAGRVVTLSRKEALFLGFGDDRRTAVPLLSDCSVAFVELASGRELRRAKLDLERGTFLNQDGRISPDGRLLALGDNETHVWLFELETGAKVHRFEHPDRFNNLAWSPDGQLLAVSCGDRQIYIWETASKRLISVLEGHSNGDIKVRFSHAGDFLISRSWDGTTRLWDPIRGRERLSIYGGFVGLSGDDRRLALVNPLLQLEIHELAPGRECRALHPGRVGNRSARPPEMHQQVDFRAEGRVLASAGDGVRLWDVETFSEIARLPIGYSDTARFRPDGTSLLTFGAAGLRFWPLGEGHRPGEGLVRIGPPRLAALPRVGNNSFARWDSAGRLVVATDAQDQQAVLVDPASLAERRRFGRHVGLRFSVPSPDGRWVATSTWQGSNVKVWDTTSGMLAWELPCGNANIGFSPDGRWLVTALDLEYRFWQVGSWKPGITIRSGAMFPGCFAFTRDGSLLALDRGDLVLLVDPETGRELATLEPPPEFPRGIRWPSFSPDGGRLAVPFDRFILVWDLRLIRAQLGTMGLDWDARPVPPSETPLAPSAIRASVEGADGLAEAMAARAEMAAGHWGLAEAGLVRAVAKGVDDPLVWHRHLLLRLRAGDLAGYQAGCSSLISRFGRDERPGFVEPVAWACALGPDALEDWIPMIRAVEAAVKQRPENVELRKTLGALLVRAGRAREAITALEESVRKNGHGGNAFDWLFLALAQHRLGQTESAGAALAKARDWIAHGDERALPDPYVMSPLPWYTKLELELLLREAEGQISLAAGDLPAEVFAPR
jgi:serine/threonine protein kinase/WD40 repeat protein